MMKWKKLGRVYTATGEYPWARSHAFLPTPLVRDDGRIRVYVAFLDEDRVGRLGYVDVAAHDPRQILEVSSQPLLDVGRPGTFDDRGINPLCVVHRGDGVHLYYVGWQRGDQVRYYLFVGLAVSDDGGASFRRYSEAPILDRSTDELFIRTGSFVQYDNASWRMWYLAGSRWIDVKGKQTPTYDLRHLDSPDGVTWGPSGTPCLAPVRPDEFGFGRPFVRKRPGGYQMWYSIRTVSKGYRIGYAESADGIRWQRKDAEAGLDVSRAGWDSEMVCFATLVEVGRATYMFYNGNNYGETGFGVAVLEA